jgi:hypothetical protein
VFGDKWGVTWKTPKDGYLVRGNGKGMKKLKQDLEKRGLDVKTELKLLGEWMGYNPSRCPKQVVETISAMRKAAQGMEWLMWKGSGADSALVEGLFGTMVVSIAKSHLIHTHTTEGEWAQIEGIKAGVGKKYLGITKRASRTGVLAELGWTTVRGWVWREQMGLYARIKTKVGMMALAFAIGIKLVEGGREDGLDTGFLGLARNVLRQLGLMEYWGKGVMPKKGKWKKLVRTQVAAWEMEQRAQWRARKSVSANWGLAIVNTEQVSPLVGLEGEERSLLAGIRFMVTREDLGTDNRNENECGLCGEQGIGGIMHLVSSCRKLTRDRERAIGALAGRSTREKWKELLKGTIRTMYYLKTVARKYRESTGNTLIPWVGKLGSRQDEGAIGMCVMVQRVSAWIEEMET